MSECRKKLEPEDFEHARQVKTLEDFRLELDAFGEEYMDAKSHKAIQLIHPALDQYRTFAQNFTEMMEHPVETSMMWGLLFLVFKVGTPGDHRSVNETRPSLTQMNSSRWRLTAMHLTTSLIG